MKDSLLVITGNGLSHLNSWASVWFPQGNLKLLRARPLLWHHLVDKPLHALRIKFKTTYQLCFFTSSWIFYKFHFHSQQLNPGKKRLGGSARYFQFLLTFVFWTVSFPVSPTTVHFNGIFCIIFRWLLGGDRARRGRGRPGRRPRPTAGRRTCACGSVRPFHQDVTATTWSASF